MCIHTKQLFFFSPRERAFRLVGNYRGTPHHIPPTTLLMRLHSYLMYSCSYTPLRWMAETADVPEVERKDPNGGAIDCKQVRCRLFVTRRDRLVTVMSP